MLINFETLCKKYNFIPKGIIHVGAHTCEEEPIYKKMNVKNIVWVEAITQVANFISDGKRTVINEIISDVDGQDVEFKITNNIQSSSILNLKLHKEFYPDILVSSVISGKTISLDTMIDKYNININNYDFLNMDIQGAEYLALKGFVKNLDKIKYIYTEANIEELYEGCGLLPDIIEFLTDYGFELVEKNIIENLKWGDVFFIKK